MGPWTLPPSESSQSPAAQRHRCHLFPRLPIPSPSASPPQAPSSPRQLPRTTPLSPFLLSFASPSSPSSLSAHAFRLANNPHLQAQPRQPPGRPDGGQWAATRSAKIARIIAAARLIKAGYSDRYWRCVDLCYPLLERLQPAGSDFNLWDDHKGRRACLNRQGLPWTSTSPAP